MIARREVGHAVADLFDDAGRLVARGPAAAAISMVPLVAERSLWHTPHAPIFTVTSPRRGGATSISSTTTAVLTRDRALLWPCGTCVSPAALSAMVAIGRLTAACVRVYQSADASRRKQGRRDGGVLGDPRRRADRSLSRRRRSSAATKRGAPGVRRALDASMASGATVDEASRTAQGDPDFLAAARRSRRSPRCPRRPFRTPAAADVAASSGASAHRGRRSEARLAGRVGRALHPGPGVRGITNTGRGASRRAPGGAWSVSRAAARRPRPFAGSTAPA